MYAFVSKDMSHKFLKYSYPIFEFSIERNVAGYEKIIWGELFSGFRT